MIVFLPSYACVTKFGQALEDNFSDTVNICQDGKANGPKSVNVTLERKKIQLASVMNNMRQQKNHILFAVATAGLAEGIDFKDDLCRLLLVVGVPYPNIADAYIKER